MLDRSASVPMPPRTRPWSILQSAVLRFKAGRGREDDGAVGFSRTASDGSGAPTMPGKVADTTTRSREGEVEEFLKTQQEVQQLLEARQENASQVLQRSYRSHVARSIYKDERFVQLESPANIIVGAAKGFLARRAMNYNRRVWPLVTILKSPTMAALAPSAERDTCSQARPTPGQRGTRTPTPRLIARSELKRPVAHHFRGWLLGVRACSMSPCPMGRSTADGGYVGQRARQADQGSGQNSGSMTPSARPK